MNCVPLIIRLPGSVHVGDHGPDVSDDGGEHQDTHQEVQGREQVLHVLGREIDR